MAPVDAGEDLVLSLANAENPPHVGGGNGCFVDGAVRFLKTKTPIDVLQALTTVAGGEELSSDKF
jgi:prepilin-type processing-associated H-X9-DG protein